MAAPANSVESEMATEDYKFLLSPLSLQPSLQFQRSSSYFQLTSSFLDELELELEHGVDAPYFATSLDVGPFSPSPLRLPFSPWLLQNQEHDDIVHPDASTVTPPYVAGVSDPAFLRLSLDFPPKSSWLPQNQEHDDIPVHPNASTVTRKRKRKHRSRKNNGRTSSGVGSDDKFNQGVDESVDGRTIGKLFVSNREIAKGSNGTIVLEGTHEVRPVAVKRLVKAYHDVADKEYQNLCVSDRHSNIVRLYGVEEDQHFVYLALERCTGSLNDLIQMQLLNAPTTSGDQATEVNIEYKVRLQSMKGALSEVKLWEDNGYPSPTLWKLMRDMVSGLVHLHALGMVHRDLKPQNVLIVKEGSLCAKLADMGISKRCGTSGWRAPELLRHGRQTRAIDVFSLGCVLFYCITGGKHPFGGPLERDMNIVNGKVKLFLVKHIPEAVDLFDHLLDQKAELRPMASEVLIHPMFWDSDKRLSFLRDASDRVQREDSGSAILKELERRAPRVLGTKPASKRNQNMVLLNWDKKIDPSLLNDIDNPRWYYYHRVRDLVRFIRNKKNHFFDLPPEIQDTLGPVPEGFDGYFRNRFPKLLMEVYKVLHKYCTEEEWFKRYFKGSAV
ncbi:hypothetical protein RHSIM_Rhsim10G0194000 [Rhododendron simsii]|uniref:non-specific serine/threonine protein kinase n=1 Tax=Rhododendron simsii TaxID=118357 RepID=A0A834GC96_RHOSS|nr:hypothetical protein RHSIM_Rhsim10G0194000 [Rhododendron simsii]